MTDTTTAPADPSAPPIATPSLPMLEIPTGPRLRTLMGHYSGPRDLDGQLRLSEQLAKAKRAVPWEYRENPGDITALMYHAIALDIELPTAWDNLHFNPAGVGGMRARLIHALLLRAGHSVVPVHHDDRIVRMFLRRGDGLPSGGAQWTIAEAQRNGLLSKDNSPWRGYAGDMLWARCLSRLARRWAPDVTLGFYAAEELDDITSDHVDEGLDPVDTRTAMRDVDGNLVPAPDVVALLADVDTADIGQLRDLWKRAGEEGLMGAYAGNVGGVMLSVRDLLFDLMSAVEATVPRTPAGVPMPAPVDLDQVIADAPQDVDDNPGEPTVEEAQAGTGGKLSCGCYPAAVAAAGKHEPGCTRDNDAAVQP